MCVCMSVCMFVWWKRWCVYTFAFGSFSPTSIGPMVFNGSSLVPLDLHTCLLFFTWDSYVAHLTLSLSTELAILSYSVSAVFMCT